MEKTKGERNAIGWVRSADRMPDNPNELENECLVKTENNGYMFATWSIHLKMWRRIEVPFKFDMNKVIDEILAPEDVIAWVPKKEIEYQDEDNQE